MTFFFVEQAGQIDGRMKKPAALEHAVSTAELSTNATSDIIRDVSKRVLIVEDDADLRGMFRQALLVAGFDVQEASDGLSALRIIDSDPPDVVVLDLGLPTLSGHAVRREIAAQRHAKHVSVVIVTGRTGEYRDLDVAAVLKKPVSPEQLIAEVRNALVKPVTPT